MRKLKRSLVTTAPVSCLLPITPSIALVAKCYGMRTAFIDRRKRPFGQTPHQPDLIVANFAELAATLT